MVILMLGVGHGIEKANKVMMPAFFILFVILAVYVAFQPGAREGYQYIFRIDPAALRILQHGYLPLDRHSFPCQ